MATKYFVLTNPNIGATHNWNDTNNWSLSSGGAGGAGIPTKDDDVIIDSGSIDHSFPLNNLTFIDGDFDHNSVCRNLTVSTGFGWNFVYTGVPAYLFIYGELTLTGSVEFPIKINYGNNFNSYFYLLGTCGEVTGVIAKKLISERGKRIYFDPNFCTITDTPYWLPCNDVIDPDTGIHTTVCGPITRHIQTATQLQAMKDHPDDNYILDNDIDLLGFPWVPVGFEDSFTGSFDGQNHKISNLSCSQDYASLFTFVGAAGIDQGHYFSSISSVIKNVVLEGFILDGTFACGALIGECESAQVSNCHVKNITITGDGNFASGGLIGECFGFDTTPTTITDCSVEICTISGSGISSIGGMIGETICRSTPFESPLRINNINIQNCFVNNLNINGVDSSGSEIIGGLVGGFDGTMNGCYCSGIIKECNYTVGGLIGISSPTGYVSNCYSHTNLEADTDGAASFGGFMGECKGSIISIINCYSSGYVKGVLLDSDNMGGFIGYLRLSTGYNVLIQNCYSAGIVTSSGSADGGFIAKIAQSALPTLFSILNCAWWTGSFSHAIGSNQNRSTSNESLSSAGYGTDEATKSLLYHKEHPVYAQGT